MSSATPDSTKFPEPHEWATWIADRHPQFKTHSGPGMAKNAISGKMMTQRSGVSDQIACDCYVYTYDSDLGWVEQHFLPKGTVKDTHPLYQHVIPRKREVKPPSEKALNAAIASIMKDMPEEGT